MKVPTVAHVVLALPLAVWAMSCFACEEGKEGEADRKSTLRHVLTQENKGSDQARRLSHEERAALHRGLRRAIREANDSEANVREAADSKEREHASQVQPVKYRHDETPGP